VNANRIEHTTFFCQEAIMNMKKTKAWLLSAAIAGGIAGFSPIGHSAFAKDRDGEEWVKYEDTPKAVRNAIDGERGRLEVKRIDHVNRDGREFYRATIDARGGEDAVIRVSRDGRILSREDVRDPDDRRDYRGASRGVSRDTRDSRDDLSDTSGTLVKYNSVPARVRDALDRERGGRDIKSIYQVDRRGETTYRATINDRVGDRVVTLNESGRIVDSYGGEARTASDRTGSSRGVRRDIYDDRPEYSYRNSGEHVDFDRLPGEVKTVIGREAKSDRVRDVTRFRSGNRTIYEAVVGTRDDSRVVRVDENGRMLDDRDDFGSGRRAVSMRNLPGEVKTAIGREINDVEHVTEYTRGGRTYYRATGANGDNVTVDDRGRVVRD
jgi:hypothetical protein